MTIARNIVEQTIGRTIAECERKANELCWAHRIRPYRVMTDIPARSKMAGAVSFNAVAIGRGKRDPETVRNVRIRFNAALLMHNTEADVVETVRHEYAHVVALSMYGDATHGPQWKAIARKLGSSAGTYHRLNLAPQATRARGRHAYKCSCREWALTSARHNRVVNLGSIYICPDCRGALTRV